MAATAVKPATSPMGAPVLTPAQIQAQATKVAQAALAPQQQTVYNQQAEAARAAVANSGAITGLHGAAADMLASIAPTVSGAYDQATQETGQLAGAFSGDIQSKIADSQAANARFAAAQGQSAPGGGTQPDPQSLHDVLYGLGGYIPGSSLASQGAAATAQAAQLPAIDHAQAVSDLNAQLALEATNHKSLQDNLTQIASQYPQLREAALQALETTNLNSRQFNESVTNDAAARKQSVASLAETVRSDKASLAESIRSNKSQEVISALNAKIQADAEKLYEAQFGYKQVHDTEVLQAKDKSLQIQLAKMQQSGAKIDVGASKLVGYVVDYNREPVLAANGKIIVVKPAPGSKAITPYQRAVGGAKSLHGSPMANTSITQLTPGIYFAAEGATGGDVFPRAGLPTTTNNPSKARRSGSNKTFVEAQTDLVNRFGVTRAQARKALIVEGWVPDGVRPKK